MPRDRNAGGTRSRPIAVRARPRFDLAVDGANPYDARMHIIDADFETIDELPFFDTLGSFGTYILWSQRARVKPTYIGQGEVAARLQSHMKEWAGPNFYGVIAMLNDNGPKRNKADSEILEVFLLEAAEREGLWPARNKVAGHTTRVEKLREKHGVLRINVTGFHPFKHPGDKSARLKNKKVVSWDLVTDELHAPYFWPRSC